MSSSTVLASSSPRRRDLLGSLGIEFEAVDPDVEELTSGDPQTVVVENALRKARAGRELAGGDRGGALVIGADTDVVLDGEILGKPADAAAAREILTRLRGREHEVHGGLAAVDDSGERSAHELSTVRFRDFTTGELEAYLAAGAWRGFAGGYAIQGIGAMLVAGVDGDVANVIGLPVARLLELVPGLLGNPSP